MGKEENPVIVTVLCVSLYFMRLQLYAVNCKKLDSIHRISFLWASMLWMTSMTNVCVITKRNIVTSTIGLVFLIARSDVSHPRHTTSEPCEHVFGNARRYKREDTVQEFVDIVEKLEREWAAMYESNFVRGRTVAKGYGSIYKDFLLATMDCSASPGTEVIIDIDNVSSDPAVLQLWGHIKCVMNNC